MSDPCQLPLFGGDAPTFDPRFADLRRVDLGGGAWLDHQPGWVRGHVHVFAAIEAAGEWKAERRVMYEREVDVPRLTAGFDTADAPSILPELADAVARRYRVSFARLAAALYRDGNDSVAWHADKVLRDADESLIALVSLGEPRRFLLRAKDRRRGAGARRFHLGWGDLLVMGGTTQRDWEHCVPKQSRCPGPRMSVQMRWVAPAAGET